MKEIKVEKVKKNKNFRKNTVFYLAILSVMVAFLAVVAFSVDQSTTQAKAIDLCAIWFVVTTSYLLISHR